MEDSRILNDKILIFICRKTIEIPISEEDSYEKNVVMYVVIGEPRHIAGNLNFFSLMFLLTSAYQGSIEIQCLAKKSVFFYFPL